MTMKNGVLRRVALVRTDVSEDRSAFIIRVTRIGELGTTSALTSNRHMLRRITDSIFSLPNIPEDGFLEGTRPRVP
jgi:hypothetical protein